MRFGRVGQAFRQRQPGVRQVDAALLHLRIGFVVGDEPVEMLEDHGELLRLVRLVRLVQLGPQFAQRAEEAIAALLDVG